MFCTVEIPSTASSAKCPLRSSGSWSLSITVPDTHWYVRVLNYLSLRFSTGVCTSSGHRCFTNYFHIAQKPWRALPSPFINPYSLPLQSLSFAQLLPRGQNRRKFLWRGGTLRHLFLSAHILNRARRLPLGFSFSVMYFNRTAHITTVMLDICLWRGLIYRGPGWIFSQVAQDMVKDRSWCTRWWNNYRYAPIDFTSTTFRNPQWTSAPDGGPKSS